MFEMRYGSLKKRMIFILFNGLINFEKTSMQKNIIFVSNASALPGRTAPITGAIFSWFREKDYIQAVRDFLKRENLPWSIEQDNSEADIEKIKDYADIVLCAPGLSLQFNSKGFNKKMIIYLSTIEYATNNIERVCKLVKSIEADGKQI